MTRSEGFGRRSGRAPCAAAILATAIAVAAVALLPGSPPTANAASGGVRLAKVGNFAGPDYVAGAPGVKGTIYVVEITGRVIAHSAAGDHVFLDLHSRVSVDGEGGLLSIAFDPHFRRNHLVYAYYSNKQGNVEIDEFHASATSVQPGSRRTVLVVKHPPTDHRYGGTIQFGPRGFLYAATGDGGIAGDSPGNAQNKKKLVGKLLRINPHRHGTKPYSIPRSNPFVSRKGRNEIYALGFRNPFRFSFDKRTGAILIGDVGENDWEEVDYESQRRLRGANFGWSYYEGLHHYAPSTVPKPKHRYRPPIHEYPHTRGRCAIIGGDLVRDRKLPSLDGRYVYADLCTGKLWSLVPHRKHATHNRSLGLEVSQPDGFGVAHGHVYIASLDGPVYRLAPTR